MDLEVLYHRIMLLLMELDINLLLCLIIQNNMFTRNILILKNYLGYLGVIKIYSLFLLVILLLLVFYRYFSLLKLLKVLLVCMMLVLSTLLS